MCKKLKILITDFKNKDGKMPIQAFQLTNFFIEDLFHAEVLEMCETATDEVVTYNNNQTSTCISSNDTKRRLLPEESEDASYQPLIRACSVTDTSMLIGKGEFNRRKRWSGRNMVTFQDHLRNGNILAILRGRKLHAQFPICLQTREAIPQKQADLKTTPKFSH